MPAPPLAFDLDSPDRTAQFAERLAQVLRPGDCVLLEGPIGAGKTHLARSLIHALQDVPEDVPSPTFTLVQTYPTRIGEVWHADLYRLSSPDEIEELGLAEAFEAAICLVEWPDRLGDLTPPNALTATLTPDADDEAARRIILNWRDPKWPTRLTDMSLEHCNG